MNPDKDLFEFVQPSGISPNLDILLGGTIPPNPTELVARDTLEKAVELLKARYDYVLLDTAPIGLVTDTAIISRVADMCIYVCRVDAGAMPVPVSVTWNTIVSPSRWYP